MLTIYINKIRVLSVHCSEFVNISNFYVLTIIESKSGKKNSLCLSVCLLHFCVILSLLNGWTDFHDISYMCCVHLWQGLEPMGFTLRHQGSAPLASQGPHVNLTAKTERSVILTTRRAIEIWDLIYTYISGPKEKITRDYDLIL